MKKSINLNLPGCLHRQNKFQHHIGNTTTIHRLNPAEVCVVAV